MILNNYLAMRHVHSLDKQQLALADINELYRIIAQDTLRNARAVGRLQRPDEARVHVADHRDDTLLRKAPAQYSRAFLYTETDDNDLTYFIHAQPDVMQRALNALDNYLARKTREIKQTELQIKEMV